MIAGSLRIINRAVKEKLHEYRHNLTLARLHCEKWKLQHPHPVTKFKKFQCDDSQMHKF